MTLGGARVGVLVSEASDFAFWKFLSFSNTFGDSSTPLQLSLAKMASIYTGTDQSAFKGHLLQAQVSAVTTLIFERFRSAGSIDFASKQLPTWFRTPDFLDEKKWPLACVSASPSKLLLVKLVL